MSRHFFALILYGIGLAAILFSLVRTYYRVSKIKKETTGLAVRRNLK